MQLFGFEIRRKDIQQEVGSVVTPSSDDGSTVVNSAAAYYGLVMDVEGIVKNENDLIRRYREVAQYADTDGAIDDIVNESIISDEGSIKLDLDKKPTHILKIILLLIIHQKYPNLSKRRFMKNSKMYCAC